MKKWNYKALFTAAVIVLSIILVFVFAVKSLSKKEVAFVVSIDGTSSIDLFVDKKMKVIRVEPFNEEMTGIIKDLKIKNVRLSTAVTELIEKMFETGYIDTDSEMIFVRIEDKKDKKRLFTTEKEVCDLIRNAVPRNVTGVKILSTISQQNADKDLLVDVAKDGVSLSKELFIKKIFESYTKKSKNRLFKLSYQQLYDLMVDNDIDTSSFRYVECGSVARLKQVKDREYITQEQAKKIAIKLLGGKLKDIFRVAIKYDINDSQPVYNLQFTYGNKIYKFVISATLGRVLDLKVEDATDFIEDENIKVNLQELEKKVKKLVGVDSAYALSLAHLKLTKADVVVTSIDLALVGDTLVYEVVLDKKGKEIAIKIDAATGDVVTGDSKLSVNQKELKPVESDTEAFSIAVGHAGLKISGVVLEKVELSEDKKSYVVIFTKDNNTYTYGISAETGEIITNAQTDKSNSDNDKFISIAKAVELIAKDAGLEVADIELEKSQINKEKKEYKIIFKNGKTEYDYTVNAVTGEINGLHKKVDGKDMDIADGKENFMSKEQAIDFALMNAQLLKSGVEVEMAQLDEQKGVYYISFKVEGAIQNYTVNAITGEAVHTGKKPAEEDVKKDETEDVKKKIIDKMDKDKDKKDNVIEPSDKKKEIGEIPSPKPVPDKTEPKKIDDKKSPEANSDNEISNAISSDTALFKCLDDLSVTQEMVTNISVKLSSADMLYDVKFKYNGKEYTYKVDAVVAMIIDKNIK